MHPRPESREYLGSEFVFASEQMRNLLFRAEKAAASSATVLIHGESGSGKEFIARAIHHHSRRSSESWVDVNCAALPESLMESELFGYERGAFSGADASKPGLFELADAGTLFLDEIGELDQRMQVKLLRVLDGAPYYRLGGVRKVSVDVRVVAATNRDLEEAVKAGRFRFDLYQRLSQVQLRVPPLRERRDDIAPLARHFLAMERPNLRFSQEALDQLNGYSWPGNVRELRNVVMRAAVFSHGEQITAVELSEEREHHAFSTDIGNLASVEKLAALDEVERAAIVRVMQATGGHRQTAATRLGISRRTLQRKIKSYGLEFHRSVTIGG
jgi:DNA-binding NtrC family response regulator